MAKIDKLVKRAEEHFDECEQVLEVVAGTYETERLGQDSTRSGVLIATNQRLLFYAKKLTGFELESFSYKTITSFERGKTMMGGTLQFHSSGSSVSMKWVDAGTLDAFVVAVKAQMDEAQAGRPAMSDDPATQIHKLADLRDSGILSEEEFAVKKQELLDRM